MAIDDTTAQRLLDDERRRLEEALALTARDLAEERLGQTDELSSYDQHPAEQGTETNDMERDLGLRADFERRLQENEDARRRVEEGRFGTCTVCGQPIADERLRAMPSTPFCITHAEAAATAARPGASPA